MRAEVYRQSNKIGVLPPIGRGRWFRAAQDQRERENEATIAIDESTATLYSSPSDLFLRDRDSACQ